MCCGTGRRHYDCQIHDRQLALTWCSHHGGYVPSRAKVKELEEDIRELEAENALLRSQYTNANRPIPIRRAPVPEPPREIGRLDLE